jgi:COMPASS component SWD1
MATISAAGRVYMWSVHREEHWSAYAPDFSQLEENVHYVEREDEFDKVNIGRYSVCTRD